MQFRTYEDLNRAIMKNLYKIPADVDLLVGVPRSGLMAALLIGLYLNLPVASLGEFLEGRMPDAGGSKPKTNWIHRFSEARRILVVEDSVHTGASLLSAKTRIEAESPMAEKCSYMAVYVVPESRCIPDFYFEVVNGSRVFQWNFLTHSFLSASLLDMDGVLCYDPTAAENDDGEKYQHFLHEARPKLLPKRRVGAIATARLEKYRLETEAWLSRHGVEYGKLYMLDSTADERRRLGNHADFKAAIYAREKSMQLFIESDDTQARRIFEITGKPVFCVDSQQFYSDGARERRQETIIGVKQKLLCYRFVRKLNEWRKARR